MSLAWSSGRGADCKPASTYRSSRSWASNFGVVSHMVTKKKKPRDLRLDPQTTTIVQAQAGMSEAVKGGASVTCPCCKQVVEVDDHVISPAMAKVLIILYRHFKNNHDWVNVPEYLAEMTKLGAEVRRSDWVKLRQWATLIEDKPGSKGALSRLSEVGCKVVLGEAPIHKTARTYNGRVVGYGDETTSLREILGDGDYDRTMAGDFGAFLV